MLTAVLVLVSSLVGWVTSQGCQGPPVFLLPGAKSLQPDDSKEWINPQPNLGNSHFDSLREAQPLTVSGYFDWDMAFGYNCIITGSSGPAVKPAILFGFTDNNDITAQVYFGFVPKVGSNPVVYDLKALKYSATYQRIDDDVLILDSVTKGSGVLVYCRFPSQPAHGANFASPKISVFLSGSEFATVDLGPLMSQFASLSTSVRFSVRLASTTMVAGQLAGQACFKGKMAHWHFSVGRVASGYPFTSSFKVSQDASDFFHQGSFHKFVLLNPNQDFKKYYPVAYDSSTQTDLQPAAMLAADENVNSDPSTISFMNEGENPGILRGRHKAVRLWWGFLDFNKFDKGFAAATISLQTKIRAPVKQNTPLSRFCTDVATGIFSELVLSDPIYEFTLDSTTLGVYNQLMFCNGGSSMKSKIVFKVNDGAASEYCVASKDSFELIHQLSVADYRVYIQAYVEKTLLSPQATFFVEVYLANSNSPDYTEAVAELTCSFDFSLNVPPAMHQFRHGLGNIKKLQIPDFFVSVFSYEYTHIAMAEGSVPYGTAKWAAPCTPSRGSQDDFVFWSGTYDFPVPVPGNSIAMLGCKSSDSLLMRFGCVKSTMVTTSIPNCLSEYQVTSFFKCDRCAASNYIVSATPPTSDSCNAAPGPLTSCEVVKYINLAWRCLACPPGMELTIGCAPITEVASNFYLPELQTVFMSASPMSFTNFIETPAGSGLYQALGTVPISSVCTLMVYFRLDYDTVKGSQAVKSTAKVYFGSKLMLIQTLAFDESSGATVPAQPFRVYMHQVRPDPALQIKVIVEGSGFSILPDAKYKIQEYLEAPSDCQVVTASGSCRACKWMAGYYLTNSSSFASAPSRCSPIPVGMFPNIGGYEQPEVLNSCDATCYKCLFNPQHCTECISGRFLWRRPTPQFDTCVTQCPGPTWGNNMATPPSCDPCDSTCGSCEGPNIYQCKNCTSPSYKLNPRCNNALPTTGCCVLCNISNCAFCDTVNNCIQCLPGFDLVSGGTSCNSPPPPVAPTPPPVAPPETPTAPNTTIPETPVLTLTAANKTEKEAVKISATWDNTKLVYTLRFSRQINVTMLAAFATLVYDRSLMSVDFPCFTGESLRTSCEGRISIADGVEVINKQIVFNLSSDVLLDQDSFVLRQSVPVSPPVNYYVSSKQAVESIGRASAVTGQVTTATSAVTLVASGPAFSKLLKLTQYLELALLFNLQYPANFKAFLQDFASNPINAGYNPLEDYKDPKCELKWAFVQEGKTCLFLTNNAELLFNTLLLISLKLVLVGLVSATKSDGFFGKYLRKANSATSWNLWLTLADSVMFDVLLASVLNLQRLRFTDVLTTVSGVMAIGGLTVYAVQMVFVFHYCRTMFPRKAALDDSGDGVQSDCRDGNAPATGEVVAIDDSPKHTDAPQSQAPELPTGVAGLYLRMKARYYFEDAAAAGFTAQYKILLLQLKTALSVAIVVLAFDWPVVQVVGVAVLQVASGVTFWIWPAHASAKENFKHIFTEVTLGVFMVGSVPLIDSLGLIESPQVKYLYMGYALMGITGLLFAVIMLITLYETVATIVETLKKLCKKKNAVENQNSLRTIQSSDQRTIERTSTNENSPVHRQMMGKGAFADGEVMFTDSKSAPDKPAFIRTIVQSKPVQISTPKHVWHKADSRFPDTEKTGLRAADKLTANIKRRLKIHDPTQVNVSKKL